MTRAIWLESIVVFAILNCSCAHVPDQKLIDNFRANEAIFNQLKDMASVDSNFTQISPRWVTASGSSSPQARDKPLSGMDSERYSEYLNLFKILSLDGGVIRNAETVWFKAEVASEWNGGITKGYVYSSYEQGPLVADLDTYVPAPNTESRRPRFLVFRALKSHWYLYELSDG